MLPAVGLYYTAGLKGIESNQQLRGCLALDIPVQVDVIILPRDNGWLLWSMYLSRLLIASEIARMPDKDTRIGGT